MKEMEVEATARYEQPDEGHYSFASQTDCHREGQERLFESLRLIQAEHPWMNMRVSERSCGAHISAYTRNTSSMDVTWSVNS